MPLPASHTVKKEKYIAMKLIGYVFLNPQCRIKLETEAKSAQLLLPW